MMRLNQNEAGAWLDVAVPVTMGYGSQALNGFGKTEIVLPAVLMEIPLVPTMLDVAGACIQIVLLLAAVDWDSVMGLDPANTQSTPVDIPVLPAVFPVLLTPRPLIALWFD